MMARVRSLEEHHLVEWGGVHSDSSGAHSSLPSPCGPRHPLQFILLANLMRGGGGTCCLANTINLSSWIKMEKARCCSLPRTPAPFRLSHGLRSLLVGVSLSTLINHYAGVLVDLGLEFRLA